jgi:hypothetical protein
MEKAMRKGGRQWWRVPTILVKSNGNASDENGGMLWEGRVELRVYIDNTIAQESRKVVEIWKGYASLTIQSMFPEIMYDVSHWVHKGRTWVRPVIAQSILAQSPRQERQDWCNKGVTYHCTLIGKPFMFRSGRNYPKGDVPGDLKG